MLDLKREIDVALWRHKERTPSINDHHTPLKPIVQLWKQCYWRNKS